MEAAESHVGAMEKFSLTGYKLYGSGTWGAHSSLGSYKWLKNMKFPAPKGLLLFLHNYSTLLYLANEKNFFGAINSISSLLYAVLNQSMCPH